MEFNTYKADKHMAKTSAQCKYNWPMSKVADGS